MKILHFKRVVLAFCASLAVGIGSAVADPVTLLEGEVEIPPGKTEEFPVTLPTVPENSVAVVEFTAWYQAKKFAGYYASLQIFLDREELMDIMDRPAEFGIKDGRTFSMRGPNGWRIALLSDPDGEAHKSGASPYSVVSGDFDITRFRFELPANTDGPHHIRIRNRVGSSDGGPAPDILCIRDLKIRFLPR